MLNIGDNAPAFSLPDQNGHIHSLSDYSGKWLIIYFYPKDDTPGCTTEACGLRDAFPAFSKINISILGVSKDSPTSHKKFAEKYQLLFPLLADEKTEMQKNYGVWQKKSMMGKSYMGTQRSSFIIDPLGKIAKIYLQVKPAKHADELLNDLALLQK